MDTKPNSLTSRQAMRSIVIIIIFSYNIITKRKSRSSLGNNECSKTVMSILQDQGKQLNNPVNHALQNNIVQPPLMEERTCRLE